MSAKTFKFGGALSSDQDSINTNRDSGDGQPPAKKFRSDTTSLATSNSNLSVKQEPEDEKHRDSSTTPMDDLVQMESDQVKKLDAQLLDTLYELYFLRESHDIIESSLVSRGSDVLLMLDLPNVTAQTPIRDVLCFLRGHCDSDRDLENLFSTKPLKPDLSLLKKSDDSGRSPISLQNVALPTLSQLLPPTTPTIGSTNSGTVAANALQLSGQSASRHTARSSSTHSIGSSSPSITSTPVNSGVRLSTRQSSFSGEVDSNVVPKEQIAERAKLEASVLNRVAELRKTGMWSLRRLPKVHEPVRHKTHWDYLLEEMTWLSTDFNGERKWKKNTAKKWASKVIKYHQDKDAVVLRAEREHKQRLRKIAATMAKEIRAFWTNIEKIVDFKQDTLLDKKRKQALNLQLDFLVEKSEKYSTLLSEGLTATSQDVDTSRAHSAATAEESTIVGSEQGLPSVDESNVEDQSFHDASDEVFELAKETLDEEDEEETIEKEEELEGTIDHEAELKDLADEADLPIEELIKKYQGAYSGNFSPDAHTETESTVAESHGEASATIESISNSDEEETEEEEMVTEPNSDVEMEDIGLESLLSDLAPQGVTTSKVFIHIFVHESYPTPLA